MRIESTYTFPAPVDRVFTALADPDVLRQILPGCERLIQLGPPDADGMLHGDVRLKLGPQDALYTANATLEPQRQPAHLAVSAHGQGPQGTFTLRGSVDLVAQDERTVAAYVWDLEAEPGTADDEQRRLEADGAARYALAICERLEAALRAGHSDDGALAEALTTRSIDTARGKIVLLPPEPAPDLVAGRVRPLLRAGAWVGAGVAAGLAAIAVAASILRRWQGGRQNEPH